MSIANDYQNLADYVSGFATRQVPIEPRLAAMLATALLDLADRAKLLERRPVEADEFHDV